MKIQLTKTKTIEFSLPGGGGGSKAAPTDIVGVEVGGTSVRGCPAVRIVRTKAGNWQLKAAGFVPSPVSLPEDEDSARASMRWGLPAEFRAPTAALVVNSPRAFARMTTLDAIAASPLPAGSSSSVAVSAPSSSRKLGVKRDKPAAAASPTPEKPVDAGPISVKAGEAMVHGGMRFMARPFGEGELVFQTGLPEVQAAWAARLLPEGRRPTAGSLQTLPAALLSAPLCQTGFKEDDGNGVALFVMESSAYYVGYREWRPVLFGECPGAGTGSVRAVVKDRFGIEDALVDSFLADGFFEPGEILAPIIRPVLQQLRTTLDYIVGRHRVPLSRVHLLGVSAGADHWVKLAENVLRFPLSAPSVFEGLELAPDNKQEGSMTAAQSQLFVGALGAALAAGEGEA